MIRSGRFHRRAFAAVLLAGLGPSAAAATPLVPPLPFDAIALDKDLRAIGSLDRTTGTRGENRAIDYIAGELSKASIAWRIEPFEAYVSFPLRASLAIDGEKVAGAVTYSFSGNTPPGGVTGRLAVATVRDVPGGDAADGVVLPPDCRGLVIMVDSWPLAEVSRKIEQCGAAAAIFTSRSAGLINFNASPVWGTPSDRNRASLPQLPGITLRRTDFLPLAARARTESVPVKLEAEAVREWRTLRLLTATVRGRSPDFVLMGAHIDSWYQGATDNAVANSMMLAFARALGSGPMPARTVKFAWWPGHSQGRYAGSAWYADAHWAELDGKAVAYLNADVLGSRDTEYYTLVASAEIETLARAALDPAVAGGRPVQRPGRYADYSFSGIGLPSLSLSAGKAAGPSDWWHDAADTLDKVSPAAVEREYRAFAALLTALARPDALSLRFAPLADQILARLEALQAAAGARISLADAIAAARSFKRDAIVTDALLASGRVRPDDRRLLAVSRAINPVLYTAGDRFEPDEAISQPFIPGLAAAERIGSLGPDEAAFARVSVTRGEARLVDALTRACGALRAIGEPR